MKASTIEFAKNTDFLLVGSTETVQDLKDVPAISEQTGNACELKFLIPPVIKRKDLPKTKEIPSSCPLPEQANPVVRRGPVNEPAVRYNQESDYESHIKSRDTHKKRLDEVLPLLSQSIESHNKYVSQNLRLIGTSYWKGEARHQYKDDETSRALYNKYLNTRATVMKVSRLYRAELCWLNFFSQATYGFPSPSSKSLFIVLIVY